MLNRRNFLGLLASSAAGMTLDPDRLLWRQGAKLISIPAPKLDIGMFHLGDVITIAGKYALNPRTGLEAVYVDEFGKEHRFLQNFVVIEVVSGRAVGLHPAPGDWRPDHGVTHWKGNAYLHFPVMTQER